MSDSNQDRRLTRIDAAHTPRQPAEPTPVTVPEREQALAMAGAMNTVAAERLDRHAFDLARQLQQQQRELDRREAELHAYMGEAEAELRTARLVAKERAAALGQREKSLEKYERDAQSLVSETLRRDQDATCDQHFAASDRQANAEELKLAVESWRKRLSELDESERQLQSQLAQLDFDRRKLESDAQQQEQALAELSERIKAEREAERARFEQQLTRLQQREEEVDRRETALQQLHADVSRMYREAIEMRLCTQQQWAELTESISPAELSKNLAQLRRKLMEQFQLSETRMARQKEELESLLQRLDQHRESVEEQREEVRGWVHRRHVEIEDDAVRLLDREQELNRQLSEHRFLERQWAQQQAGYEQEIRRLRRIARG